MRKRGWWMGLTLLACAPAMAGCPPMGQDRASLEALKSSGFAVADPDGKRALAMGLVECLGDPDPTLRDGIAKLHPWIAQQVADAGFQPEATR